MRLLLGTAATAAVVLSGCGTNPKPPPAAAIVSRLQSDPAAKLPKFTPAQLTCVAGVFRRYIRPQDLSAYVAGKRAFGDLRGADAAAAQAAVVACVKP